MLVHGLTWQEMQANHDRNMKLLTCPVCGKRCNMFLSPRGIAMPMCGFLGHGQWYCTREHWMQDPNSSYHKRKELKNGNKS